MADVIDRPGIWQRAGLAGEMTGLSMAEALTGLPAGLDRDFCTLLLARAEIETIAARLEQAADTADSNKTG